MKYRDLRDFTEQLERSGKLVRVREPVSPRLEMTAVSDQVLQAGGPALWFEQPTGYNIPCLTNLFGTPERVALGMGADSLSELRDVGRVLASLKEPEPPRGIRDAGRLMRMAKALWDMKPALSRSAVCQQVVIEEPDIDLARLPIQTCWPGDAGALITWGLVVTRGPQSVAGARLRQNLGIYRQQLIGRRQLIMRWLARARRWSGSAPGLLPHRDHEEFLLSRETFTRFRPLVFQLLPASCRCVTWPLP
jgi:4-hydroxy-3-polyprenylbenzoate decarboxylase